MNKRERAPTGYCTARQARDWLLHGNDPGRWRVEAPGRADEILLQAIAEGRITPAVHTAGLVDDHAACQDFGDQIADAVVMPWTQIVAAWEATPEGAAEGRGERLIGARMSPWAQEREIWRRSRAREQWEAGRAQRMLDALPAKTTRNLDAEWWQRPKAKRKPPAPMAALRRWYVEEHVPEFCPLPKFRRDLDLYQARKAFPRHEVTETMIEDLRRDHAPKHWGKGRPRKGSQ